MRPAAALLALPLALAACPSSGPGGTCDVDSDCGGGLVCARDGECANTSDVRAIKVTWTLRGMMANAQTCADSPSFYIQFDGPTYEDTFGYEPVPCEQGQFGVDKLPKRYEQVEIGVDGRFSDQTTIDPATGTAAFDLFP